MKDPMKSRDVVPKNVLGVVPGGVGHIISRDVVPKNVLGVVPGGVGHIISYRI